METEPHARESTGKERLRSSSPRQRVQTVAAHLLPLLSSDENDPLVAALHPALKRLELGIFRLVVMGEVKKGKSSFINALLGEPDLLPTATDVATSTVYKLLYGPEKRFKVFFLPDVDTGKRREPAVVRREDLPAFGTENGNPGNQKRVDFIGVELPNPLLKQGLVLVDTPGVGGLFRAHRDITWRYAPNADAVCFVLDSVEAVISADEIRFLQELLGKVTKRVFFIQTKTDACDTEQWRAWSERNRAVLRDKLGIAVERLRYFPLSAKLKLLADGDRNRDDLQESGFMPLLRFLHSGLMCSKEREIARDVARRLASLARRALHDSDEQLRIARQTSAAELQKVETEYRDALAQHQAWETTTYQRELQRFADRFGDLRRRTLGRLQDELDPTGAIVAERLTALRSQEFDPAKLNEAAGEVQQEFVARCSEVVLETQGDFNREVVNLIEQTIRALCPTAPGTGLTQDAIVTRGIDARPESSLHMQFSLFDSARNRLYGGLAGATIGQVAAMVLGGLFPPVALLAPWIGLAVGFDQVGRQLTLKRREEAIARLRGLLADTAHQARKQAMRQFEEIAATYERRARDAFRVAAERMKADLQARLQDVQQARGHTQAQSQARVRELQHRRQRIEHAQAPLKPLLTGDRNQ